MAVAALPLPPKYLLDSVLHSQTLCLSLRHTLKRLACQLMVHIKHQPHKLLRQLSRSLADGSISVDADEMSGRRPF